MSSKEHTSQISREKRQIEGMTSVSSMFDLINYKVRVLCCSEKTRNVGILSEKNILLLISAVRPAAMDVAEQPVA